MSVVSVAASPSAFETTRWTVVLRAGDDDDSGRRALATLCQAYWLPLYVYVRRRGHDAHEAEDLTQSFFADLIRRGGIKRADPERGRFRTFLLSALTNFLHNVHAHDHAARRGGFAQRLSIDACEASAALAQIEADGLPPDAAFDRSWTLALLERALTKLAAEQERLGRARQFERLRPFLQARAAPGDYEQIASELGLSRNAVAVAVHRLTARFREIVRAEVADTVGNATEFESEIRDLLGNLKY